MEEEWKDVPELEGLYKVSNLGRVLSLRYNKIMRTRNRAGYPSVCLYNRYIVKDYTVHFLVTLSFIGKRPDGFDVDHIDNNRTNSRLDNLRYLSRRDNIKKTFDGKRRGVSKMRKQKTTPQRYRADLWIFGKKHFLGSWQSKETALGIYRDTHKEFFGYF